MRLLRWVFLAILLASCLADLFPSTGASASATMARRKSGPSTIRGITANLRGRQFELKTRSHGTYLVQTTSNTRITAKGGHGTLRLQTGDHVSVHGFVNGRTMTAIAIRIYPVKQKAYDVKGTIVAIQDGRLSLDVGHRIVTVSTDKRTVIRRGSVAATVAGLRVGDRVQVRVQPSAQGLLALRIHVYVRRSVLHHVRLNGTVVSSDSTALTIRSGATMYHVRLTPSTIILRARARQAPSAIRSGETVSIVACCRGQPLVAISVRIEKGSVRPKGHALGVTLRGTVAGLSAGVLTLRATTGSVSIKLTGATVYEIGTRHVPGTEIRVGDMVSVRALHVGKNFEATRVHVAISSRRVRHFRGRVVSSHAGHVEIESRHIRYLLVPVHGASVSLNGKPTSMGAIQVGDRVQMSGQVTGRGTISAQSVVATRLPPKAQAVHGIVLQVRWGWLVVADAKGAHHRVHLLAHARLLLHGRPAPWMALFPGVRVTAHGTTSNGVLLAQVLDLSVRSRTVSGRLASVGRNRVSLQSSRHASMNIDIVQSSRMTDSGRTIGVASLHVGAFVQTMGFEESSTSLRAQSLTVMHPTIDASGVVVSAGHLLVVRTTRGDRFQLVISPSTSIAASTGHLTLAVADILSGVRVRVQGTVRSDGELAVSQLIVRLHSVTIRGAISSIAKGTLDVQAPGGLSHVRLGSSTTFFQGTHPLTRSDLVLGDVVTVYGYAVSSQSLLARKLLVHRRIFAVEGTVSALVANGFILHAVDGDHQVIVGSTTLYSGGATSAFTVGMILHVTGYQRGDLAILATRIRQLKRLKTPQTVDFLTASSKPWLQLPSNRWQIRGEQMGESALHGDRLAAGSRYFH